MTMRLSVEELCEMLPALNYYRANADFVNQVYGQSNIDLVCHFKMMYYSEYCRQYKSVKVYVVLMISVQGSTR